MTMPYALTSTQPGTETCNQTPLSLAHGSDYWTSPSLYSYTQQKYLYAYMCPDTIFPTRTQPEHHTLKDSQHHIAYTYYGTYQEDLQDDVAPGYSFSSIKDIEKEC